MLTKDKVLELIASGENSYVEFKLEKERNEDLLKTIAAFANLKGGFLLIGIADDGQPVGVSDPKLLEERIMNSCFDSLKQVIIPDFYSFRIDGNDIVVFHVAQGMNKPYALVRQRKERFYLRRGTTVKEATREELLRFYQASGYINYEITPIIQADLTDLDFDQIRNFFLNNPYNPIDINIFPEKERTNFLVNKEILVEFEAQIKPTFAGLLLFGINPGRFLFLSGITLSRFKGIEKSYQYKDYKIATAILPKHDHKGNLIEKGLIHQVMDLIEGLLINQTTAYLEGAKRILEYPYKLESIREAIVNAVAHRDYTINGVDIRVELFDNRIEVHSPGKIPNTLTIEKMKVGAKYYRNQILVQYLKEAGLMDLHSLGIPVKILKLSTEYAGKAPLLVENGDEFVVTIFARTF